jgi:hypothetical protein
MKKLLLVLFFTMFPALAHGATYYVAKTGSDSNSCGSAQSQSTPKLTINAGISCLNGGDTLIIKAGTYFEKINNGTIPSGPSPGTPTTIKSEVPRRAVLQPNGGENIVVIGLDTTQSNILFDGVVLDGNQTVVGYRMLFYPQSSNVVVQNVEIKNIRGKLDNCSNSGGVFFASMNGGFVVRNSSIHNIGDNDTPGLCNCCYSYGTYMPTQGNLWENNEMYNISGYAIHGYSHTPDVNNNIIRNNFIHDVGGPVLLCNSNNQIYNNIFSRLAQGPAPERDALVIAGACDGNPGNDNAIYNNTIYGSGGTCIALGTSASANRNTVRNNICWQNSNDAVTVGNGAGNIIDRNLLGQNPLFVNAAGGDFHLQNGSLAIDAGVVISGLLFNGSAPDLGALETGAGGQLPAPTNLRLTVN